MKKETKFILSKMAKSHLIETVRIYALNSSDIYVSIGIIVRF